MVYWRQACFWAFRARCLPQKERRQLIPAMISAALVMLMTPGLAFFYGGMVRSKNVLTTIMQSFFIVAMVSVQWVLFGFSLAFGPDINGVIGSLSWAGLTDMALFAGAAVCLCGIPVHVCGNYGGAYYRRLRRTL